ncbi:RraA family protein [Acerihabitans sp. KWT182]|uniref:Putative 4-hydroxy-4-methyl-2-oxoglutarate aldolase n=1 Tax=Acerihabitans sp. KWT182 TaxID=3157919 RepID=A0AAU7QBE5_9GAMM
MNIEIISKFKRMDTASISDAMDKIGVPCGLLGIKSVIPGKRICGEAFTVHYVPCGMVKGNVGDFLDDVKPGQVVVIDNNGRDYCTVWGDIMTFTAKHMDIEGTLIDGVCRDIAGIKEQNYPVFSKNFYMVTGKDRVTVDYVNRPVSVSGVLICPGDLIIADDSGAIAVPAGVAEKVLSIAEGIENTEQKIIGEVKNGSTLKAARAKFGYHHLQTKNV